MAGRGDRAVAFICAVMVLTQIYVGGSLDTWAGAGSFGQRRLIGLTIFFVIGLAAVLQTPRSWMRARDPALRGADGLVESRPDCAIRQWHDGPAAARSAAQRVQQLRDDSEGTSRLLHTATYSTEVRSIGTARQRLNDFQTIARAREMP